MAVYGIGAMYGGTDDKSEEFVKREVAAIGSHPERAPGLHAQLAQIKAGDLMFIKSYAPQVGLWIKAVGIVTAPGVRRDDDLRWCIGVRWTWSGELKLGEIGDRCDLVRRGPLYEEFNPEVIRRVIDLLLGAEA
jgi:hypothetical protein